MLGIIDYHHVFLNVCALYTELLSHVLYCEAVQIVRDTLPEAGPNMVVSGVQTKMPGIDKAFKVKIGDLVGFVFTSKEVGLG